MFYWVAPGNHLVSESLKKKKWKFITPKLPSLRWDRWFLRMHWPNLLSAEETQRESVLTWMWNNRSFVFCESLPRYQSSGAPCFVSVLHMAPLHPLSLSFWNIASLTCTRETFCPDIPDVAFHERSEESLRLQRSCSRLWNRTSKNMTDNFWLDKGWGNPGRNVIAQKISCWWTCGFAWWWQTTLLESRRYPQSFHRHPKKILGLDLGSLTGPKWSWKGFVRFAVSSMHHWCWRWSQWCRLAPKQVQQ